MNRSALKQFAIHARQALLQELQLQTDVHHPEETAYLWFIRMMALRFMELNGLLPGKARVFTDTAGRFLEPTSNVHYTQNISALFQTLSKNPVLSEIFNHAEGNVRVPDAMLQQDGILAAMVADIPESDWIGHPEILGWLHQYYYTSQKESAFAQLRQNIKIAPDLIPAATQTFTPDWIVRYMVENSLGNLWTACRPGTTLPRTWNYYITAEEQQPQTADALRQLHASLKQKQVTELTVIDPCMGTGHILAYAFDVLMQMYLEEGYSAQEAAVLILQNNLYGLDIDMRVCQLAAFILLMKACSYYPDILQMDIRPNLDHFSNLDTSEVPEFKNAAVFGSLLRPGQEQENAAAVSPRVQHLTAMLCRQYDAVITNPPYMGSSNMNPALSAYVKEHYPDSKSDLFAAFMERCSELTAPAGYFAMLTQHAWMFLSSYAKLRKKIQNYTLLNMVHLGARAFSQTDVGTIVQTTAFVCMGSKVPGYRTTYLRLTDADNKERAFLEHKQSYCCSLERFSNIPGEPLCYWISDRILEVLQQPKLSDFCKICQGMTTSDNKRFLRFWHEVPRDSIAFGCANADEAMASGKVWFPYNKGGKMRKWYGNQRYVVNYHRNGKEMRAFHAVLNRTRSGGRIKNADMYFKPAVTWPFITEAENFAVRFQPQGSLFDVSGSSLFPKECDFSYLMGLLSSKIVREILELYNPTMNFQVENLSNLPVIMDEGSKPEVEALVKENIRLAKMDWDSFETSWDFRLHPLVAIRQYHDESAVLLQDIFQEWEQQCSRAIAVMQHNEERLNAIFIAIYGLTEELTPNVPETAITLHHANAAEDIRSLISFAIGCYFGRYQGAEPQQTGRFLSIADAGQYLENWIACNFGQETLRENLRFIAGALGENGTAREVISRYLNAGFYADHCRVYQSRPIYWLADSGRKHGLRGFLYLHGVGNSPLPVLCSEIDDRKLQYLTEKHKLSQRMKSTVSRPQTRQLSKEVQALEAKLTELQDYAARIQQLQSNGAVLSPHAGVPANHGRFPGIFAAIR